MTRILDAALHYARDLGWPVHPVNLHKKPTTLHGFYDATTDEATIREYFKNGAQVSIRTGATSGVVVLDLDEDKDKGYSVDRTLALLAERYGPLPHTPHQRTGRGGLQYFFKHQDGFRNKAGSLLGPGIDTRGEGGYAVAAPSRNTRGAYEWIVSPDDCPLADVPQWLIDLMTATPDPRAAAPTEARTTDAYARAALAGELARLASATNGTRNDTLNRCAFSLGQLIGAGALGRAEVEAALSGVAAALGLGGRESAATIASGLDAGQKDPRRIPDRAARDRPRDHMPITEPITPRYTIQSEADLYTMPPLRFLDRDLALVAESFHLIYGASGSGKTFFAVERAMRQVAQGRRVLYIATEDVSGLRYRVAAWRKAHPDAGGRLTWLDMPTGLDLQDQHQVADLLATIEPYQYDHIVLDTLRESHSGDENSSQDTARINRAIQQLVAAGAAVDVVHHSGVAGQRPRGSTALFSNASVVIQVENDDDRIRITFDKLRAPPRDPLMFGLCQQDTGLLDTDGEQVVSAVIRPGQHLTQRGPHLSRTERKVLDTLALSIFADVGAKAQQVIDTAEITRRHVYLALSSLKNRGYVTQAAKGDPYCITPAGRSHLGPDYVPSDLPPSASERQVIASDRGVSSSDQDTPVRDVIPSDHTRRVITGITSPITGQTDDDLDAAGLVGRLRAIGACGHESCRRAGLAVCGRLQTDGEDGEYADLPADLPDIGPALIARLKEERDARQAAAPQEDTA